MKKILPILLVLFMTGCTVNYDIRIKKNSINEKISITEDLSKVNEKISDQEISNTYSEFNNKLKRKYNSFKEKDDNSITYNLTQDYSISNDLYIRAFSECFDSYAIDTSDEKTYTIKTSEGFKCLSYNYNEIDSVNINIKVEQKVIESNADKVDNKTYTWNINEENFKDKSIYIKFENVTDKKGNKFEDIVDMDILYTVLILSGILILVGIVMLIVANVNKKKNEL